MFTASNGIRVRLGEVGNVLAADVATGREHTAVGALYADAIREFFRHENDVRLGWWRWGKSDIVVRSVTVNETPYVRAVDEASGTFLTYEAKVVRGLVTDDPTMDERVRAMRAYLDSTAAPKLLLQAQDVADVWVTLNEYRADQRAHAEHTARLLESQDVPARVIEGEPT